MLVDHSIHSLRLTFGATYTVLNQYATITPDGVRHDQPSGRLDFTGAWTVYDHESTAGSISLLIRSGTNIGMSQQYRPDRPFIGQVVPCSWPDPQLHTFR
jgi:porin